MLYLRKSAHVAYGYACAHTYVCTQVWITARICERLYIYIFIFMYTQIHVHAGAAEGASLDDPLDMDR